ncbi:MAG: indolepyruvate ferredoxin oxidoreductase subunit beta [Deltaproteobacteria bacterium]|nr:indolepyruvate ferredoxin oxidoreductase subunit beta [Deltaproteobacteria bacterium]
MEYNVVAAGIGGQGLVLFSEIFTKSMLREGLNASFYVHSGLAQLGGSVRSHIRCGKRICPKISMGCADLIVSLETAEILHAIPYLKKDGTALISKVKLQPYMSKMSPEAYPAEEEIGAMFAVSGAQAVFVPAGRIARNAGHIQAVNMAMLGCVVAQSGIVETESVVLTIRENLDRGEDINVEAFWKGYEFVTGKDYN